jgi:zinc D-Ala-D-Ala dipeptidase
MSTSQRDEPLRDLALVHALRTADWRAEGVRLRSGVVDRLTIAQTLLPRALRFLVVSGHHGQDAGPCQDTDGHATGGAVDLALSVSGSPEPTLWSATPPPEWPAAAGALMAVGMVGGGTWWHWSFGDARWCAGTGAPAPLYDVIP